MTRHDLIAYERFYSATLRREARARAKRYPAAAEQLNRFADAADRRVEEIKCGPLFSAGEA